MVVIFLVAMMLMPVMALADTQEVNGVVWTFDLREDGAYVGDVSRLRHKPGDPTPGQYSLAPLSSGSSSEIANSSAIDYCSFLGD